MRKNSDNETQQTNTSVNQSTHNVQSPPISTVAQPPVSPTPAAQASFQQPSISQQPTPAQSSGVEISKSSKKKVLFILLGLVALLVFAVVCLFVLLTPTVKDLSACMEENSKNMDILFQRGLEEKWNNQQKCEEIKPVTERVIVCYESIGGDSPLPVQLAFTLAGIIREGEIKVDKESLIEQHNTNCSQYPNTLIGD